MNLNLVLAQVLLVTMGLLGVAASSPENIPKHLIQILIGLACTFFVARIKPKWLLKAAPLIWGFTLVLLVLVLIIGQGGNGSSVRRWIDLGPFDIQPSEFAKLGLILMLGSVIARKGVDGKLVGSAACIGITALLIAVEPDLGTTLLVFFSGLFILYMAGVRLVSISKFLVVVVLLTAPFGGLYLKTHSYILERFIGFVQGTQVSSAADLKSHQADGGYQVMQGRKAIAQGGVWGLGVDESMPKVPADHTDMVISSIGFSVGFLGVLIVMLGFWLVVHSSFIAIELLLRHAPLNRELHFACIIAAGAMFMVVSQALVNLCVAVGLLPVTGVPLPLVSFGGSSGVAMGIAFGLIHAALRGVRHISDRPAKPTVLEAPAPTLALALPFAQPPQVLPPMAPPIVLPSPVAEVLEPEDEPVWADGVVGNARGDEVYPPSNTLH